MKIPHVVEKWSYINLGLSRKNDADGGCLHKRVV